MSNESPSFRLIVECPSSSTNIRLPWSLSRPTSLGLETPIMLNLYSAVDGFPGNPFENDAVVGVSRVGPVGSLLQAVMLPAANARIPNEREVRWFIAIFSSDANRRHARRQRGYVPRLRVRTGPAPG